MTSERRIQLVGLAAVVALAAVTFPRLEVVLDLAGFMLGEGDTTLAELSKQVASSEASRTLVVVVEGPDTAAAVQGARAIEARLRADPAVIARIASMEGGPEPGFDEAVWRLYQPRLLAFAGTSTDAVAKLTSNAGLASALDDLQARLRTPASALLARVAPRDPLLILPRLFDRLAAAGRGGVSVVDGRFVSRSGHGVLFIRTLASAFRGAEQAPLLDAIRAALPEGGGLRLRMGGLHRFAVQIQRSIEADILRVSILSTLALMLIVLGLFRSPRIAGLVFVVVGCGLVTGLAVTVAVFGRVHGLTLAFGASLIGVSVDYAVHFFVHHTVEGAGRAPRAVLGEIGPGLVLGAATTVVGFVALAASSLPGLLEVSVFAAAGILGALAATWIFLPGAVASSPHRATPTAIARALDRGLGRIAKLPKWAGLLLFAAAAAVVAVGGPRVTWNDDVAELTRIDPELVAEEEWVRAEVSPFEQRRFVVATGDSLEAALQVNDELGRALEAAGAAGELERWRGLADLLPAPATQGAIADSVRRAPGLKERLRAAAAERGFRAGAFAPFERSLVEPLPPPLTYAELAASPLGGLARAFRVQLEGGGTGILTFLGGVADPEAVAARVGAVPGARWLDQKRIFAEASRTYRERTVLGLAVGFAVVILLVGLRYRRFGRTAAAVAPATLAVAVTVATLGLLTISLDLVGLTALLMVFSMGVDYGVFLAEAPAHAPGASPRTGPIEGGEAPLPQRSATTLLAVLVAWISTLAGFGLLALSTHPAMRTIGLVASIGLTTAVLLAPTSTLWARRAPTR